MASAVQQLCSAKYALLWACRNSSHSWRGCVLGSSMPGSSPRAPRFPTYRTRTLMLTSEQGYWDGVQEATQLRDS